MKHRTTTTILLVLSCFALSPMTQAVTPAPDGGYSGGNTAEGANALFSLTTGTHNTAVGARTLYNNTIGLDNTAVGWRALYRITGFGVLGPTGFSTAVGSQALYNAAVGDNTAVGSSALYHDTQGFGNTAIGASALFSNTTGTENAATGDAALRSNNMGNQNTANGIEALYRNTTGSGNIALGYLAGVNLTTGDNNVDIGNTGVPDEANTIRIGTAAAGDATYFQSSTFISGIYGGTVASGATVIVGSDGHLGTIVSSARFKDDIKPMEKASEAILALKPVTFRYKHELDPEGIPQFGLVAEQVEKVNPDLVARDDKGKLYTVRYEAVNAMLLNEFLKEHCRVEQQEATIIELKRGMEVLTARLKDQEAQIQEVSDQLAVASPSRGGLEVSKPAPQMVMNNQ